MYMQLHVYQGEIYHKSALWYALFGTITLGIVIVGLLYGQYRSVIIFIFIIGAYFFFSSQQYVRMFIVIEPEGISFGPEKKPYSLIQGFSVDGTGDLRTIIFVINNQPVYYTIVEDIDPVTTKEFFENLYQVIPYIQNIKHQPIVYRRRFLKL
ncbi:MAG: hypothetical protein NZL83_01835 [Candidatus Absconditabacterales bacterium]|nr:hypothetical protein [Candidatus Absconditabacterales bacterium]